jgi:hypothetical protein
MERRHFIKTAGTILVASPWLSPSAQAQSFTSNEKHGEAKMSNDTQSPGPNPAQLEVHPGWVRSGVDNTPGHKAYYINLEAKPGKGDKVEQFLRDILAGVEQEPGTVPCFGCGFSYTKF